jgi:hypothetical protein
MNRVIAASPALLAREQQTLARTADALAVLFVAETGAEADDVAAQVAANALVGVNQALIRYTRRRLLTGLAQAPLDEGEPAGLAAGVRGHADRALALLEHGLGDYAPKPAARSPAAP